MNFNKRIENLKNYLVEKKLDLLILDDPISLLYLTGLTLSLGKIFISKEKSVLFVDGRYFENAKKHSEIEVRNLSEKNFSDFIINENEIQKIGFDSSIITYNSYEKLSSFIEKIKNVKNSLNLQLIPIANPLKEFRSIKDLDEISLMKQAAALNWKGFEHACQFLKEGITEKQLALEYEIFVKKNGAQKLSFDPIVCFGKNSSKPHHVSGLTKLKLDDIVLMDIGCTFNNYSSDMTRVIFFGKADPTLEKIYSITKKAQMKALSLCRPNTKIKDLDLAAREVFKEENYENNFVHSLGHGVGLEIHEYPRIKSDGDDKEDVLKQGMVITIEPGLYIPDFGGVRYEDTILITQNGYENFYSSI
ncbi:MAG: aminopeptidase P family protein [Parachlamydiales bacterium]|nr:aminopeptidase P family protein [Parachlamydiales bacterium]